MLVELRRKEFTPTMAKLQLSLRTLLLTVAAIAVLIAGILEIDGRIEDLAANGYRVQAAGDLLVHYMKNRGQWPKTWDDLRRFVDDHKSDMEYPPNISDLKSHVRINFNFDPATVNSQSESLDNRSQFVVVSSTYGRTAGATHNPNQYIYDYLCGATE